MELANLICIQHVRMNALKGADKDSFEVAFHEVERRLLAGLGPRPTKPATPRQATSARIHRHTFDT